MVLTEINKNIYAFNGLIIDEKYIPCNDLESYYKFRQSNEFKILMNTIGKTLKNKRKFTNFDVFKMLTSLEINIENVSVRGFLSPFHKIVFSDFITYLENEVGDIMHKEFTEYKDFLILHNKFKSFDDYFYDLGLVNFSHEQAIQTRLLSENFDEKQFKNYIKLVFKDKK